MPDSPINVTINPDGQPLDFTLDVSLTPGPQGPPGPPGTGTGEGGTSDYNDLTNKPVLGTVAALNVPLPQSDVVDLETDLATLVTNEAADAAAIAALATRATSDEGLIGGNTTAIAGLTSRATADEIDITSLKTSRTSDEAAIAGNTGDIVSLKASRTTDEADIASLKTSRTTDEIALGTNTTDIAGLKSSRTADEANIATNTGDITSLKASRTTDEANIGTAQTDIVGLKASRTTDESNITSLLASRTADETNIATNTGDITSLKSSRTTDESNITSLLASRTTDEASIVAAQTDITSLKSSRTTDEAAIAAIPTADGSTIKVVSSKLVAQPQASAVSTNANNKATLGSDSLILVQGTASGVGATTHAQTVSGDDPALTNARTPTSHGSSHTTTDLVPTDGVTIGVTANKLAVIIAGLTGLAQSQVTGLATALAAIPPSTNFQAFTTHGSFTWTKPTGAKMVEVWIFGAGGGGGGGRKGAVSSIRTGGGSGGGGSWMRCSFQASDLAATVPLFIGLGGAGGVAATANDTNGGNSVVGTASWFISASLTAPGGPNAFGGQNVAVSGLGGPGLVSGTMYPGNPALGSNVSGVGLGNPFGTTFGCGAGGSGGCVTAAEAQNNGGSGSVSLLGYPGLTATILGGTAPGGAGVTPSGIASMFPGAGGGGGAASNISATNGGAGGNGSSPGGGGGGGGAGTDSINNSGAGGTGADGAVFVVTYF